MKPPADSTFSSVWAAIRFMVCSLQTREATVVFETFALFIGSVVFAISAPTCTVARTLAKYAVQVMVVGQTIIVLLIAFRLISFNSTSPRVRKVYPLILYFCLIHFHLGFVRISFIALSFRRTLYKLNILLLFLLFR